MAQFEAEVAPGKRGVAVDEAIALWMEEQRRSKIRARIEEYFQDEAAQALDAEIDREWAPVSDELWAQLPEEDWPEPAVVFPRGYAAYLAENQTGAREKTSREQNADAK